jgi:hypothetical protein
MLTETKLSARLIKSFREMGAEVLNIYGNKFQSPGWPDCFVCHKLWTGFLEFKGPTTKLQPNQERIIRELENHVNVWIVRITNQDHKYWEFDIINSTLQPVVTICSNGKDGQVAARLFQELARLDGVDI